MKHVILILASFWLSGQAKAQSPGQSPAETDRQAAFSFIDSIFHRPSFTYETLQPEIPKDMQTILIRFNNAIVANRQWFIDYRNKYSHSGQSLPYSERFGITADEYRRIQNLESIPPALVAIDSQTVTVKKDAGLIHFHSSSDSHLLDYLLIDPTQKLLLYGGDTIPFAGRLATGPSSPYGQWQGYTWRMEKADAKSTLDSNKLTARVIEIDLGLTREGQKVFLRIKYQDLKTGITTANMELLAYLQ